MLTNTLPTVPFYSEADPNFYMEVDQDNFTNANGSDRLVVYWVYGVSISVAMSTPGMLDVFFEVPNQFKGNSTKGLFGKTHRISENQIHLLSKDIQP